MEILMVEPAGKKKHKITFDTCETIVLYQREARQHGLLSGNHLTREEYEQIVKDILLPRAKKRVLYLLQSMDRTEAQLRKKLKEGFFPEQVVNLAIDYGKSFHYIDDEKYARSYVNRYISVKSRRMISLELEKKGISKEYIQRVLEETSVEHEHKAVEKLILKKHLSREEQDFKVILKVKQALFRRGFAYEVIESVMNQYLDK